MRSRLHPVPYRRVARVLRRAGFAPIRQVGSHERWRHPDGRAATVPRHHGRDIRVPLLRKILREAELDEATFLDLM